SGCIAVTLASKLPQAQIWGVDISAVALEQARRNATRHGVAIELRGGSYFEPLSGERFDLIVANPPYIRSADIADLQPEVRQFEPLSALDGGSDGLDPYRQMIPSASEHLSPGGWLLFEVGYDQAPLVRDLFHQQGGYGELFTTKDLQGIERVVGGRLL
ncbi:MAG TPA: HemK/PrmC family methyltransferase, partial [Geobacterales bacterium]|nr:HemK/PrmC family methyltransferase [Geobacterales bacterium]